jgi:hypothetical protein
LHSKSSVYDDFVQVRRAPNDLARRVSARAEAGAHLRVRFRRRRLPLSWGLLGRQPSRTPLRRERLPPARRRPGRAGAGGGPGVFPGGRAAWAGAGGRCGVLCAGTGAARSGGRGNPRRCLPQGLSLAGAPLAPLTPPPPSRW